MLEEKKAEPVAIQNLPVTMIGVRSEGTGQPIANGQILVTSDAHQPNLVVRVIRPVVAIAIRAAHTFVKTMLGGLGLTAGAQLSGVLPWATVEHAFYLALATTAVDAGWSAVTILGNLERENPLLTGSV